MSISVSVDTSKLNELLAKGPGMSRKFSLFLELFSIFEMDDSTSFSPSSPIFNLSKSDKILFLDIFNLLNFVLSQFVV